MEIGSIVGRSITVDVCIEASLKGTFARVCVEIDDTKPLFLGFHWDPRQPDWQEFLYQNVGVFCFRCENLKHHFSDCLIPANNGVKHKVAAVMGEGGGTGASVRDGGHTAMASNVPDCMGASMEVDGNSLVGQRINNLNSEDVFAASSPSKASEGDETAEFYGLWLASLVTA